MEEAQHKENKNMVRTFFLFEKFAKVVFTTTSQGPITATTFGAKFYDKTKTLKLSFCHDLNIEKKI